MTFLHIRILLLSAIVFSLSSCTGWHLRGTDSSTIQSNSVYLQSDDSTTATLIQQRLDKKSALTSFISAQYVLIVENEKFTRRTASVDSAAVTTEYELSLTIDYEILDGKQNILRPQKVIRIVRAYTFDPNDVAGKDKEELIIKKDLHAAAARQILQQLQLLQRQQ